MTEQDKEVLFKEAAGIYLRYRQNPEDAGLIAERDAFIARGVAEAHAWKRVEGAWRMTGVQKKPKPLLSIAIAASLLILSYFAVEPLRIFVIADHISDDRPFAVTLSSGDLVTLDAGSALIDETNGVARDVRLLRGAGYFDVQTTGQAFAVMAGDFSIEVLGTKFEVARVGDAVQVAVHEGRVAVTKGEDRMEVAAGEMVIWSEDPRSFDKMDVESVAVWRFPRLVASGLTFAQVAATLDRRIAGPVVIADPALAEAKVSGTFDLERPMVSLRNLAASQSATVLAVPALGAVIIGGQN